MVSNVLLVVIDALRYDRTHRRSDVTPTLDALANEGAMFTNAYSTANATDPAITSLHTGRYPLAHGIINHGSHVTEREKANVERTPQFTELLRDEGIHTSKIGRPLGRWHRRGFDVYPDISRSHWGLKTFEKTVSRLLYDTHPRIGNSISQTYNAVTGMFSPDEDESERLTEQLSIAVENEPFYACVHLMDTHTPYSPDDDLVSEYLDRFNYDNVPLTELASRFPPGSITRTSLTPGGVINAGNNRWTDTEYEVGTALVQAQYDAAAHEADAKLKRLIDELDHGGILDETLLIVLSDHGESLNEHGIYFEHHGLYEPTIHIPLVIRAPHASSRRIDELVQITDIAPTVMESLSIEHTQPFDGQSLQPLIKATEGWERRKGVIAEEANTQRRRMVRTTEWKLIAALEEDLTCRYCEVVHAPSEELYYLDDDPEEARNMVEEDNESANRLRTLMTELVETRAKEGKQVCEAERTEYDDEKAMMDHLEALGYR